MMSSLPRIKDHFLKFGETVSVKGVSRIIKAQNRLFRALWLIAVVASLCILLWQLSIVFLRYFNWPVDTVIEESVDRPLFPDVTFCNTNPTRAYEMLAEKMNFTDYYFGILQLYISEYLGDQKPKFRTNKTATDMHDLDVYFSSRTAYILNFPIFDKDFTFEDGLVYDHIHYDWHWREMKSNCSQTASIQLRWNPNYIGCRTIRVPDECRKQVRGVALILYLDNFSEMVQFEYQSGLSASRASGVLFAVHPNGTEPDLRALQSIGPGTETNIRLSPIIRSRLPSPYGDCTSHKYVEEAADSSDEKLRYTKDLCIDICYQQQIMMACGCLSTAFPFTPYQIRQTNGTVCGNLSMLEIVSFSQVLDGFERYMCTINTELNSENCEKKCTSQCEEFKYDMTVTTAPWPHVTSQLAFSNRLLKNKFYKSRFDIYHSVLENYRKYYNGAETIRFLESVDLIEKNFLQVNIFFDSYSSLLLKDVPSLTADKMMGFIGGGLSLWLGITIMTLVEVVEFIGTLIDLYVRRKKISEVG